MNMSDETIFKVGDRVFDIRHGWGTVVRIYNTKGYPVFVQFYLDQSNEKSKFNMGYSRKGYSAGHDNVPLLSFTEYILEGFSQKREIELPRIGEEIMVSDDKLYWSLRVFVKYNKTKSKNPIQTDGGDYKYFRRLIN